MAEAPINGFIRVMCKKTISGFCASPVDKELIFNKRSNYLNKAIIGLYQ